MGFFSFVKKALPVYGALTGGPLGFLATTAVVKGAEAVGGAYTKSVRAKEQQAEAAQRLADEQIAQNKRLEETLRAAKIETLDDLRANRATILADLDDFEFEQLENIAATANQLNLSITDGLTALNTIFDTAESREVATLVESGKLSLEALEQGYTDAQGTLATSQAEILKNLEDSRVISREDIERSRDFALQQFENEDSKLMEDALISGFITPAEAEAGAVSNIGTLFGFSKRAIESLSPTAETGRRALQMQKIYTGVATDEEISNFQESYGDPFDFQKSPLYQFQLKEQEEAITRMQKQRGTYLSGAGARELLERGTQRLAAEESQRQYARLEGLRAAGQQASRDISSTLMTTGQLATEAAQRRAESLGAISTRAGEQLAGIGQNYAQLEAGVQERYGLTLAELQRQLGTQKAQQIAEQALQKTRVSQIYTGLRGTAQAEATTRRLGVEEAYGVGGTASRQLAGDLASARMGVRERTAQLMKDTRLGTASQVATAGLQGSQLANQLALQAQDYRVQAASIPLQTTMAIGQTAASLGGAALGAKYGGGFTQLGGQN
jgi:hypothetical protein